MDNVERTGRVPRRWRLRHTLSSVRGRIIVGFAFLVLILVAVAAGSAWQVREHKSDTAAMAEHADTAFMLQNALVNAEAAASGLQRYVTLGGETPVAGDEELLPRIRSDMAGAEESLAQAIADTEARGDREQAARLYQISAEAASLVAGVEIIITLQQSGDSQAAAAGLEVAVLPFREFEDKLKAAAETELQAVSALRSQADRAGNLALWLLIISGAAGAVLGLATSVFVTRSIIKPLSSLEETAVAISQGDLEARAQATGPSELAYLGSALNQMTDSLLDASKRQELEEALKESEERYRDLYENAPNCDFTADLQGTIQMVNKTAVELLGYARDDLIGRSVLDLYADTLAGKDKARWLNQRLRSGEEVDGEELEMRRADGATIWVSLTVRLIRNRQGQLLGRRGVVMDITARKQAEETIKHMAYHDSLTDLPNRALFEDRLDVTLAQAHRKKQTGAVLFLDLDRFKVVNDTVGHAVGDQLLQSVAERLKGLVREGDTVARVGGDEFTLLLTEVERTEEVVGVAGRVLDALRQPWLLNGHEFRITASIGIAMFPNDGEDADSLLRNADTAMYRAKDQGRDNYMLYTPKMNTMIAERLALENSLRHGLERGELLVYYQPQVDIASGRIVGMEALVRWQHPERGLVSPGEFIPLAEETGLIVPLGAWVMRTACAQNKAWQAAGIPPMRVAVNLSARQFQQRNLTEMVDEVLKETDLEARWLQLEITEGVAMQDVESNIAVLRELRQTGVQIAIDEFGTGHSSLSYLSRLPIDVVKIDQSFIQDLTTDPNGAAIARSIIVMAHNLKLRVIAEGVETEEQLEFLKKRRCDEMQGYLFSKPAPAEAFDEMLRRGGRTSRARRPVEASR